MPLDVYDSATMSAIVGLSGQSIAKGGAPVEFPDFTRGKWETTRPKFAVDETIPARVRVSAVTQTSDGMLAQTLLLGQAVPRVELPQTAVRFTGSPKPHRWPAPAGEPDHCLYSEADWGMEITVPRGSTGVVSVYAYAPDGQRRQTVTFQDRAPSALDELTKGSWLEYPFSAADSREGQLCLKVRKLAGANAVLSKLKIALKAAP